MEEQLITFKTAKFAKEKGFNIKVVDEYNYKGELFESEVDVDVEDMEDVYSAPSQSILQRWLREVHGIHIVVEAAPLEDNFSRFSRLVYRTYEEHAECLLSELSYTDEETKANCFETYELALENALQKGLKLI